MCNVNNWQRNDQWNVLKACLCRVWEGGVHAERNTQEREKLAGGAEDGGW